MTLDLILRIMAWWAVGIIVIVAFLRFGVARDNELDVGDDEGDEWEGW